MKVFAQNKILIIITVVVIIAAIIFWPKKKVKDIGVYGEQGSPVKTPVTPVKPLKPKYAAPVKSPVLTSTQGVGFPIKKGSRGNKVKALQTALNAARTKFNMGNKIKVDGVYGAKTIAALKPLWVGADLLTESGYNSVMQVLNDFKPTPHREIKWPLKLGDADWGDDDRIRRIKIKSGLLKKDESPNILQTFSPDLEDSISFKFLRKTVDEDTFKIIMST